MNDNYVDSFCKENGSGPGSDPVRPKGPVLKTPGPGPPLQRSGPTISGPDTRTSLRGPVRTQVREGQDRTPDSLGRNHKN